MKLQSKSHSHDNTLLINTKHSTAVL